MNSKNTEIAVIGMAGRFPGADSISEFWRNICDGKESISQLSDNDLRRSGVCESDINDKSYIRVASIINDVDKFDPAFFKIPPVEAELMDPQIRLLLQCAWETLEDAGHATKSPQNIGVFTGMGGISTNYYSNFINVNNQLEKTTASPTHLGNDKDYLSTYISYKLNLTGPSMTIQTACSTSLVTVHQACMSLFNNECDMALAGGANIRIPHIQGYHYRKGHIFSKTGHIRSFDENADGVVFGSGYGLVLLKKLENAIEDRNHIYAIIKGTAISNDGKDKISYAAASLKGQQRCIDAALKKAHVDAATIGFVESHGTGTYMGDPIEIAALTKAFSQNTQDTDAKSYCALGAVKANIGHLDAASGIAGFIKAVLTVYHGVIPPIVNYNKPNPRIKFESVPFYVNNTLTRWKNGNQLRRAGVNSVGIGGTNAFTVLEQHVAETSSVERHVMKPSDHVIVPLSAKTKTSLLRCVQNLCNYIATPAGVREDIDITDLSYTLQAGREAMEYRVAFVVSSMVELRDSLVSFTEGKQDVSDKRVHWLKKENKKVADLLKDHEGQKEVIQNCIAGRKWGELAELWADGLDLDWNELNREPRAKRISLPTYSFEKERYWIETGQLVSAAVRTEILHPLLHINTSDLSQQRYSSTFTGEEFFLKDHQLLGQKILPGVAYLEMARASIEKGLPAKSRSTIVELHNIVWIQPIVVTGDRQVTIGLSANDNEQIDYEIYTTESDKEIIHCQGQAVFSDLPALLRLDIPHLKGQMDKGRFEAPSLYSIFNNMGLQYGPAHQGIRTIYLGEAQLIAELSLPSIVETTKDDFLLHPSLLDGALQTSIGLIEDLNRPSGQPSLPFALDTLRVISACTKEMIVWARYSPGNKPEDKITKLDIDLCDQDGNVCVQLQGFASRVRGNVSVVNNEDKSFGTLFATPVWESRPHPEWSRSVPSTYSQHWIILCEMAQVNSKEVETLISNSQCLLLQTAQRNIAERYSEYGLRCFDLVQKILQGKPQGQVLIQLVVSSQQEATLFAGLSGLLKTASLENPQLHGQIIVTSAQVTAGQLARQLSESQTRAEESIIKYDEGTRYVLGWREIESGAAPRVVFKDQGTYLITGGLGGLGILFTKEILRQTKKARIILTGRSALTAEKRSILDQLAGGSGRVVYKELDIVNLNQVTELISAIKRDHKTLDGILHCAGMISDNFILKKTSEEFIEVLSPKVTGTFNLDEASKETDLDFMVLFSSVSSSLGNVGQSDYASANGFMDRFSFYRNHLVDTKQRQGKTVSINWPLWAEGGMGTDEASHAMLKQAMGIHPMQTQTGLEIFYRSLELPHGQTLVMEGDIRQMRNALLGIQKNQGAPLRDRHVPAVEIDPNSFREKTEDYLRKQFSALLKLPAHKIDTRAALERYGIDSILAISLTNQLERTFGNLSKTLFFEYQTIGELAAYFIKSHGDQLASLFAAPADGEDKPAEAASATSASSSAAQMRPTIKGRRRFLDQSPVKPVAQRPSKLASKSNDTDPIAIIGLSGRYPEAINIEEYWRNLRDGKDCIIEVPKERWDSSEYYSEDRTKEGHHYSKWGGFIAGVDEFDPRFFHISPREAQSIDPQERLFLQHAWMAVEDAGYTRKDLQIPQENDQAGQVGVYVGVMWSEYQLFGAQASTEGKRIGLAGNLSSIANRVSYFLNLHGPSMAVDTMCSSSLTAIHLACQDLKQGRTSLAIAGGVNISIHPNKYLMLSSGQFISSDGHCQSFGEGGDGYIPGEGVGAVVLKRLSEAERDGDHIYGIIQGSSLNHGGKTNGYSVPNPQAQAGAIHRALSESNLDARHISYIEAHGTGTKLGDPIEIAALGKAFHHYTGDTGFCLIGSAKSNIGHCESAAGIAGLTKVLLQMQHQQIVPSLHSTKLNPHIDFQRTPFIVNQTLRKWEQPVMDGKVLPRIAGISSFGAGGSNAHIILQEHVSATETKQSVSLVESTTKVIIPLSARTEEQLKQKAQDLLNFIRSFHEKEQASPAGKRLDLFAMAYTLQVGREAMSERLGFIVSSIDQLAEKLQAYIQGEQDFEDVYQGQVKNSKEGMTVLSEDDDMAEAIHKWIARKKLSKLLDLWVKGLDLDWNKLYDDEKPGRISLPTYPFARERYWVEVAPREKQAVIAKATTILHPLLHENTSDLVQQSYSSSFRGDEFFLAHTQGTADGTPPQKILPAVTCLEMARAAVERSLPARQESGMVELRNVVWGDPLVISGNEKITIALFAKDNDSVEYEIYSRSKEEEIVHCQGQAILRVASQCVKVDVEQLKGQMSEGKVSVPDPGIMWVYQGEQQVLARLRLPPDVQQSLRDYRLHPSMLASAFQASVILVEGLPSISGLPSLPLSVASVRVISPCTKEMFCRVRYSPGSSREDTVIKVDIDLYDEHGNECVQLRGIQYQQESHSGIKVISKEVSDEPLAAVSFVAPRKIFSAPEASQKIRLPDSASSTFNAAGLKKPVGIPLSSPQGLTSEKKQVSLQKRTVTLSKRTLPSAEEGQSSVRTGSVNVYDYGQGVYSIQIASENNNTLSQDLTRQLLQALTRIEQESLVKVLILSGTAAFFLRGGRQECNEAVSQKLYQAISSFPYPVIAAMQGDATGAGFLVGAVCDFMICSREGNYYYTSPQEGLYPGEEEYQFFKERLGEVRATDFLYHSTGSTGKRLHEKGWTNPILPRDQVEAYAQELAFSLAKKSELSLRLLKQHLSRHIIGLVNALPTVTPLSEERSEKADLQIISPATHIRLTTHEGSVLEIRLCVSREAYGTKALASDLTNIFTQVNSCTQYKTIVLSSEHPDFLPQAEQASAGSAVLEIQDLVLQCKVPVLCILDSDTQGMGWFISQFCDGCIYDAQGHYSFASSCQKAELAKAAPMIFTHRFGSSFGKEIVLTGKAYTGFELQQRARTITIAPADKLLRVALQLAALWSKLPWARVAAWKKQMSLRVRAKIKALPEWSETEAAPIKRSSSRPVPITLRSKVIMATAHPEGILEVKMEDREAKNMFSEAFIEGITEVFEHVEQTAEYKVVILSGYDTYFASGGTKESLLAIQEGKTRFTDAKIYHLAMACKVPVISAMQGHGIGAGWSLGMFADFILFSEESKYVSPYMNYGFTPGAGATFIFPERIGYDLSRETLLTAREYSGIDLKERGLQLAVLPRAEVQAAAFALARQISHSPRGRIISIKHQLTHPLYKPLEEAYERELAMHEKTFVGQQETLRQIENNFYQERDSYGETNRGERPTQPVPAESTPGGDNLAGIMSSLKKLLAHELRIGEHEISEDIQFVDLGLDSITGVTWIRKINEKYKTSIEATQVYSYPTLAQLGRYVKEEAEKRGTVLSKTETVLIKTETDKLVTPVKPQPSISSRKKVASSLAVKKLSSFRHQRTSRMIADAVSTHRREGIAVIGMAGQFPQARNVEEFWKNISQGRNCIVEIPQKRWDHSLYYREGSAEPGKANSKWMGALEEYDLFDPLFFNISPKEAISMDPQQRIFLQACWHSLENAGYNPRSLSGSKCGVFVGCGTGDYHQLSREHQLSAQGFTGSSSSILAGRVSYFLNLQGPCLSIETACSSSLVAISTACDSLNSGSSDVALAGGVYVMSGPQMHIKCSQSGMLSVDGRCYTFDQRANGFVPGEGVGVVVLKRLSDAERDHDMIYGVIQGWGVNQDGQTNGITAPNPESQTRLEQEVYDKFRIDPAHIQLVEAHGTGTKLGDPIEVRALKETFKKYTQKKNYCALTSVKSNIGHCLTAAGVASFIKTVQALNHKQLPPTINFNELNEHIGLQDSPFYVNNQLQNWELKETDRRQAAISSFGFSGTNAHIVVTEYVSRSEAKEAVSVVTQNGKVIVPLSARTVEQLKQKAIDLLDFIGKEGSTPDLIEIAYTLQAGREAMEERLGFMVSSIAQLAEKLQAYINEASDIEEVYQGQVKHSKESIGIISQDAHVKEILVREYITQKKLSNLLNLWVKGLDFDWNKLYGEVKPQRISLPTYPFVKERYWIEATETVEVAKTELTAKIHQQANIQTVRSREKSISLSATAKSQTVQSNNLHEVPATENGRESKPSDSRNDLFYRPFNSDSDSSVNPQHPKEPEECISQEELQKQLKLSLAQALSMKISDIDVDKPFIELGLDSIIGVEWVSALNKKFSINVTATKVYEHPTIKNLAQFIKEKHFKSSLNIVKSQSRTLNDLQAVPPTENGKKIKQNISLGDLSHQPSHSHSLVTLQPYDKQDESISQEGLQQQLKISLAEALGMKTSDIDVDRPFIELGLDSIIGVEWVSAINKKFNINVTATKVYEHPTIKNLAQFLKEKHFAKKQNTVKSVAPAASLMRDPVGLLHTPESTVSSFSTESPQGYTKAKGKTPLLSLHCPTEERKEQWIQAGEQYGFVLSQPTASLDDVGFRPWVPPALAAHEMRIHVKASAINFPDTMCVSGLYPTMPDYPFVPGFEVSGIVAEVGSHVTRFKIGDPVIALTGQSMGGHASFTNVSECDAVHKPCNISFEEGCSLPVVFATVHYAFELAKLGYGESVLIHTATGGIGLMALQLAAIRGAIPYATTSKVEKVEVLKKLGVSHILNYLSDFDKEIIDLTCNRGVDVVLNMLSGNGIQKGLNCLAPSGRYLEIAVHALKSSQKLDLSALVRNQSIYSIDLRRLISSQDTACSMSELLEVMKNLLESRQIVPIVSRIYPIHQIADALHYVSNGQHIGKVVISHSADTMTDLTGVCIDNLNNQRSQALIARKNIESRSRAISNVSVTDKRQPIAVIGMAGQFPQAKNVEEFWQNIAQGKNCISEIPRNRWDINSIFNEEIGVPGKTNSRWMGALEEYDLFDPLFFNISPIEAERMDPQQRVFLQACWHAIENAGYNAKSLSGSKCGVFAGCGAGDYYRISPEQQLSAHGLMGSVISILAARISYFLNLQGPCLSIDTACSSSLVAIAEACESLTSGNSDLALAGGVTVFSGPSMHIMTSQSGMLSPDGRCYSFDQRANGFVAAEGVGVVMLKRLADAEKDQDIIYGVIEGWGVNQDGKTNGITAPNPESQARLQREVYDKYNIDPSNIQLIEAHGTGTKLGDPIEVEGLKESFKKYTRKKGYCALSSVKSNIGHGLAAAGVSGFIKLLMALKHKQLPPTINFNKLNEHIDLEDSPFYINDTLQDWNVTESERRQSAISSFGFSGTNAHLVLAEYRPIRKVRHTVSVVAKKVIIPLSARTPEQLRQKVRDLLTFIGNEEPSIDLIEMAYTLQVGREALEERVGFVVSSVEHLVEKLRAYVDGNKNIEDAYYGQVKRNQDIFAAFCADEDMQKVIDQWVLNKKLHKVLDIWVKGLEFDWNKLYEEVKPKRIVLPGYPFAKERYWMKKAPGREAVISTTATVLHPLLHVNTSDITQQRYSSAFHGEEFFLKDHQLQGQKVLPGVAYLEMARAAIEKGVPAERKSGILELRNTVWLNPFAVEGNKHVSIVLSESNEAGASRDQIDYEIYSTGDEERIVHCQGQVVFGQRTVPDKIDPAQLKEQMRREIIKGPSLYASLIKMGLNYGPAFQGVRSICLGEKELVAHLHLPSVIDSVSGKSNPDDFLLHPSLMDSALQSSIALVADLNQIPDKPFVPFALESVRIVSACTAEMFSWIRYSPGSKPEDKLNKLDIDLCDEEGNVCVQMRGFTYRVLNNEIKSHQTTIKNSSMDDNGVVIENGSPFDAAYYQDLIQSVLNKEVTIDEAANLG